MSKIIISTHISIPGLSESTYETTASIAPGESPTKDGIVSLIVGHLALLNDQLNTLKEGK